MFEFYSIKNQNFFFTVVHEYNDKQHLYILCSIVAWFKCDFTLYIRARVVSSSTHSTLRGYHYHDVILFAGRSRNFLQIFLFRNELVFIFVVLFLTNNCASIFNFFVIANVYVLFAVT